jgi:uncharacterized protein YukJ
MAFEMKNQTGSFFKPRADQSIFYQGKIKLNNEEVNAIIIKNEKKEGGANYRIFVDIGGIKPLTNADKQKFKQNPPSVNGGFTKDFTEYWFTAWTNETKDGDKYLSATIEPKEEQKPIPQKANVMSDDEDFPF